MTVKGGIAKGRTYKVRSGKLKRSNHANFLTGKKGERAPKLFKAMPTKGTRRGSRR